MAEGIFRHLVEQAQVSEQITIDSSGTSRYHIGELADERMRATAAKRGLNLTHRARQILTEDLEIFDLIVAMDRANLTEIRKLPSAEKYQDKLVLMRDFDPQPEDGQVPDPYFGGQDGFENVARMLERSGQRLLAFLMEKYALRPNGKV
ncbi:protein-tyrosine phosphatase [Catalinimonas alkaloidigena]|uniref:protein-tyrosine-phosphatase n=2 Tax=Catalinimonas alkaloidigena TaxID=1075417 RepID=A0A1G9DD60_9BACT|nr:protein-tyrosine phosphatase [Catalinimonas alkaloidigena]